MPTSRCYNCGLQGHQTQVCPRYGPRYPEPGKSSQDYGAEVQRIMDLIAADIVAEHTADHEDLHVEVKRRGRSGPPMSEREREARTRRCTDCGVGVNEPCLSASGKLARQAHVSRRAPEVVNSGGSREAAQG